MTSETTLPPWPAPVVDRLSQGAFLLLDKPRGPSSHQVTAWARDLLGVGIAGHAGTLDPNVSGLLWVGVGPALKLLPLVLEFPKRYLAAVNFHSAVPRRDLDRVVAEFTAPIYQTPPVRSAVKRERRVRRIHRLIVVEVAGTQVLLDAVTDSGTYLRTLAVDLGEALGTGGHLEELRRVSTGPFDEAQSIPLTALADAVLAARAGRPDALLAQLHPIEEVWREFPTIVLKDGAASAVAHGAGLAKGGILALPRAFPKGARVALVNRTGTLVATGVATVDSKEISSIRHGWVVDETRVFADPGQYPAQWRRPKPSAEPPAVP
jgi:H/ACA ribonucleoprotein complex subunit 4